MPNLASLSHEAGSPNVVRLYCVHPTAYPTHWGIPSQPPRLQESKAMPSRSLDQATFDKLVEAYRERPGAYTFAARHAQVCVETARRAWVGPPFKMWAWGKQLIPDILEQEKELALLKKRRSQDDRKERELAAKLSQETDEARRLEEEARKVSEATIRAARQTVLMGYTGLARVTEGINKLAERVGGQLSRGTDAQGNPINLDAMEALRILQRYAQSVNTLTNALDTLTAMERVKQNLPTAIMGIDISNITLADAERELETARSAVARAQELGLVVHEGGRKAV